MGPVHRGGTTGNLGLTWGWRTLSPQLARPLGRRDTEHLPLDYRPPFMEKVVVILTDGNNQFHDQDTGTEHARLRLHRLWPDRGRCRREHRDSADGRRARAVRSSTPAWPGPARR